ncbi:hypothetical protein Dsin_012660 [Dipteronia sinensis]|uniref:Transposase MuDR plant domain-containing protein n=1 Tax=Dipteronia sinensis TaxID=43782 RepID=A0AAE0AJ88_9ROSI|nr:hypothetical protein Dsin_012660 [Dipteronia sinensis]
MHCNSLLMGDLRLLISHGGQWFGQNYEGGDSEMAFVPPDLTYNGLIKTVEDIVTFDSSTFNIELRAIMNTSGRRTIVRIKNDRDVSFLMQEERVIPEAYVTIVGRDQTTGGVKPTLTIHTTDEETSQESDSNDRDGAIGCEGTPPEFETNTDHGLDNLDEQYPLREDESFVDFIVEEDNREGVNCGSPNFKVDSGGESDASDHSHSSGHHDDDLVGNTTTQMGSSSLVPRPWSILGSEQYSFQTINHECSSSNSRFYKGRIFSSKKVLKRELSLMALKQHFEFRIRRFSKARFQATCKDDNCSFRVHAKIMDKGEYWQIRKIDKEHSCTIEGFQGRFRQANSSVIGELVSLKLWVNGTALKPKEIMTEMQHKGIEKTMRIVYLDAPHSLCVFHLTMNLKNTFKREDVTGIFKRAYKIYRESEFNEEMSELMRVHPNAYNDLMTIGPTKWSRAYSPVRRYFMMTSNIAECINSCLRHARQFPVTVLIEYIRDMMQKWFHDRRIFADSLHTQLTPWATKYLTERNEESTFYTVRPIDWNEFEVKNGAKDGLVNLLDKTCTCREFDLDLCHVLMHWLHCELIKDHSLISARITTKSQV